MKAYVLDENSPGCDFLEDYRVTVRFYNGGAVMIDKIERFCEKFQVYTDITTLVIPKTKEIEQLRDQLSDWYIGEQLSELDRRRAKRSELNNDDFFPDGAA